MEKVIIPKNVKIGEYNDDYTGVTVILAPKGGAVCGVEVRGNAPGTRETDLLKNEKSVDSVNAIVLAGGSAYGLAASTGVMQYFQENEIGFKAANKKIVPIVPSAVIFDLNDKEYHYPTSEYGYKACLDAQNNNPKFGKNGVGKGATCGKIRGLKYCSNSGVGAYTIKTNGIIVTAIVCVNALGDIYEDGKIIAGAKNKDGSFFDTEKYLCGDENILSILTGSNTTIGCIITDAKLSKLECNKLASIAHNGYARSIRPVHTDYDGDTIFAMSVGSKKPINFLMIETAAVKAMEMAIIEAVKLTKDIKIEFDVEE